MDFSEDEKNIGDGLRLGRTGVLWSEQRDFLFNIRTFLCRKSGQIRSPQKVRKQLFWSLSKETFSRYCPIPSSQMKIMHYFQGI